MAWKLVVRNAGQEPRTFWYRLRELAVEDAKGHVNVLGDAYAVVLDEDDEPVFSVSRVSGEHTVEREDAS